MFINIQDDVMKINNLKLLNELLFDRTTRTNIIWATDAYSELSTAYDRDKEIRIELITGLYSGVIKTRARKALEQKSARTRQHAEVFTPLWIVNKMNNYIDEMWFGYPNVFNKDDEPTSMVRFDGKKTWKDYVDSKRLEITCGEAPYIVSRYDVETGEIIKISRRVGILDRKLRVVNENAVTENEWMKWALRAVQATYGYEFQGDNLLIARINVLMTFVEYMKYRWNREPNKKEYRDLVKYITWNIWQMDGLSGTIPYCKAGDEYWQMNMFEWMGEEIHEEKNLQPRCRIYDWRGDSSMDFLDLYRKGKDK